MEPAVAGWWQQGSLSLPSLSLSMYHWAGTLSGNDSAAFTANSCQKRTEF